MSAEEVHKRTERALAGNLEKDRAKLAAANKLFVRDRLALLLDDGSFVEDALLANALADDLPADGVVTGTGRIDGRPVCVMANDSDGEGGLVGRAHRREDRAPHRDRAQARAAGRLPRRLGRRPHHRPGRALPGPARRGPDLRQPGATLGSGAAGVLPVRAVGRGRCVHPGVLRRRLHGGGQRLDVPRLTADGGRGDRRGRDARRDGRRAHARHRQRVRRQPRGRRRRGHRRRPSLAVVPAHVVADGSAASSTRPRRSRPRSRSPTSSRWRSGASTTSTR